MIYDDAKELMTGLDVSETDGNFEIALEIINKYGSYKRAMQATIGIEFKKKEALLIALLGTEEESNKSKHEDDARRLIDLVRAIADDVFRKSEELSIPFNDLVNRIKITAMNIPERDITILEAVKPHRSHKLLISNINTYQDGSVQLKAFIEAIEMYENNDTLAIGNVTDRIRIKRR